MACSQVEELWQLYLLYGVLAGVFLSAVGWVIASAILTRWSVEGRATALGLASAGIGFGILVLVPLTQGVILEHGWRSGYLLLGVLLGLGLPLVSLLVRLPPERVADTPRPLESDAARSREAATAPLDLVVDRAWVSTAWSVGRAVRTRRYWLLLLGFDGGTFATQVVHVHQVAMLVESGFDPLFASWIVALVGVASIGAKPLWGFISDRVGREPAVLGGADIFQGRNFGAIFGTLVICHGFGGALGSWLGGYVRDVTGQHELALLIAAVGCAMAVVFTWLAAPRHVRLVPGVARRRARLSGQHTPVQ